MLIGRYIIVYVAWIVVGIWGFWLLFQIRNNLKRHRFNVATNRPNNRPFIPPKFAQIRTSQFCMFLMFHVFYLIVIGHWLFVIGHWSFVIFGVSLDFVFYTKNGSTLNLVD